MTWNDRRFIYGPSGEGGWMNSHAQVPTVLVKEDRLRVYLAVRESQQLSMITFVDLDRRDPTRVLYVHDQPILPLGKQGAFDEFGVMPSCVLEHGGMVYLYTTGWSRGTTVPYVNSIGLAVSADGGVTFERPFEGPLLGRSPFDPYSGNCPYVLHHGGLWRMWYGSGTSWVEVDGRPEHVYVIKEARSLDGIAWQATGVACLAPAHDEEATTRPSVLVRDGAWHMWFCYRDSRGYREGKGGYRIGYAHSVDGINWRRRDTQPVIEGGGDGWDGQMQAYPCVVELDGQLLMFYNGNDFGRAGFGFAVYRPD